MIARFLALVLSGLTSAAVGPAPADQPAGLRVEYFVLEIVDAPGSVLAAPPAEAHEVGLAVLRKRRSGDRLLLEWELRFREDDAVDMRVHHVEVLAEGLRKFVWREYRPGQGSTLFLEELDADGHLRSVEWGGLDGLRTEVTAPEGALFPLDLIERARGARVREGELVLFDALERRFERMSLSTHVEVAARSASFAPVGAPSSSAPPARTVEVRRADGSLAGAYRFVGADLEAFQWQAGSARGRRVPAEAWQRRSQRLDQADQRDPE